MTKEIKKNIPLTKEFMTKKVNDGIYGFMLSKTTGYNKQTILFMDNLDKKEMAKKCNTTVRTIDRQIKTLKGAGLIEETTIKGKKCLVFTKVKFFQEVELPTLNYLLDIFNSDIIRVYAYLLDKYQWKRKTNEYYTFDIKELIIECLGLKTNTNQRDYASVNNILEVLINLGFISIKEQWIKLFGKENATRQLVLTFVATSKPETYIPSEQIEETKEGIKVIVKQEYTPLNVDAMPFLEGSIF